MNGSRIAAIRTPRGDSRVREDELCLGEDGLFKLTPVAPRPKPRPAAVDKRFRAFDPHQVLLLPPSLDDWLPEDHLARFVADLAQRHYRLSRCWWDVPRCLRAW
ncbi:hypothetical protein Shyhy01_08290 [Streptomyces hygroscopicus subsp. hygroscopicus]|nr:hypothetical protein Shyhy01_08290 [Streptomyces hygroscopicus subsp. hygroscopicus]